MKTRRSIVTEGESIMRIHKTLAAGLSAVALAAAPAIAQAAVVVTFNFNGAGANAGSATATDGTASLTATARRVDPPVADLTALSNLSQLSTLTQGGVPLQVTKNLTGVGVFGGQNFQLDTNFVNQQEALLFTSNRAISITGLKLGIIDINDTLQLYGVNADNSLVSLGYGGTIASGLGGAATASPWVNNGTTTLTLNSATGFFKRFLFTTAARGSDVFGGDKGQGYVVGQITATVPEPGTWGMMILGMGMLGYALRRRGALASA